MTGPVLLLLSASLASGAISEPVVFEPGSVSGQEHDSAPAFAPDGQTVWFSRSDGVRSSILESHLHSGRWSNPEPASFSGRWSDLEPAIAPDGSAMVFVSNRPADRGNNTPLDGFYMGRSFPAGGGNLWRVERTAEGWSVPVRLPDSINSSSATFAPSLAADGSLWFMRAVDGGRKFQLFRAQSRDGKLDEPLPLPFSDGTSTDVDPAVAPDESFVVFGSGRKPARSMDLFIAFRRDGRWGEPEHLGDVINSAGSDAEPRLSPDSHTLYFSSERLSLSPEHLGAAWNNGKYNIWQVDLSPWFKGHP